jgi:ubiquinone/menaquinone biosynthesis C-methylase UbiE
VDDDVEYVGLMAEAWDALRGETSQWEDRHFYLDLIRERGQPVLDVGCGTGRLLLDFLALGIDIEGVDNSAEMLDLCRRKASRSGLAATLYLQPMQRLRLPRRYRTILVPSSSFQLLLAVEDARDAMEQFHEHLERDGTLVMPFIVMGTAKDEHSTREATLEDGSTVRRTAREVFDAATRIESTDDLYEVIRDGVVIRSERHVRNPATRAWSEEEVAALLAEAGFVDVEWCSNFTRQPHQPDDEIFTVIARRD